MQILDVTNINAALCIDGPNFLKVPIDDPADIFSTPVPPWNKGIPHTEESKEKMRKRATGRKLSKESRKKISKSHLGKKHPEEVKKKIGQAQVGEKNHNYQYDWKLTFECGKVIITSSMPTWCKNNGYDKSALMRVCKKQVGKHKDIVTVEKLATVPAMVI